MSLHDELLDQAEHLALLDDDPPRQANLRRAASSAYYALFHLLTWETTALYANDPALASQIGRTLNHMDMRKVSEAFLKGRLPEALEGVKPPATDPAWADLKFVTSMFIQLQQTRHEADYDLAPTFDQARVLDLIQSARDAFKAWSRVRNSDLARVYLGCFQLWKAWDVKRP